MLWLFAAACLIGFCAACCIGAAGLGILAILAIFAGLFAGCCGNLPFWTNIGAAFLVSATLQLSYLLGLLSATVAGRRGRCAG
jgi:hypothetical protein